jgi:hypothetical protein
MAGQVGVSIEMDTFGRTQLGKIEENTAIAASVFLAKDLGPSKAVELGIETLAGEAKKFSSGCAIVLGELQSRLYA